MIEDGGLQSASITIDGGFHAFDRVILNHAAAEGWVDAVCYKVWFCPHCSAFMHAIVVPCQFENGRKAQGRD